MGRAVQVPITPSVLAWAIEQSGLTPDAIAHGAGVEEAELNRWLRGAARPSFTAFKRLAHTLRRPTATFLLPAPPRSLEPRVEFRHPPGMSVRDLLPEERQRIREVHRLQRAVAQLLDELGDPSPGLPTLSLDQQPAAAGQLLRDLLGASAKDQTEWPDVSAAFRAWRARLEALGTLVFLLPMGRDAARGFSIWHDGAPAIVVNTHWNAAARIYTLFHELAHLLTRTNSVCVESVRPARGGSDVERWCERVAAAALMPASDVRALVDPGRRARLETARYVAGQLRVSMRAAALRLVDLELADWSLFRAIPAASDGKPAGGGGGGGGRDRSRKRLDEYGRRTTLTFVRALKRDVISAGDAMRYLDVGDHDLDELEKLAA